MKRRCRSRFKQLLVDFKKRTDHRKLKKEALDRTLYKIRFGRDYEPVARETMKLIN